MLLAFYGVAAQPDPNFGAISVEDLARKVFEADSSAEAVVLFEKGVVNFKYSDARNMGFYIETEIHIRKKIFKSGGLSMGSLSIPYYVGGMGMEEMFMEITAVTYNLENGKVVKSEVNEKSVFIEKSQGKFYRKKVTFPNVREGSIIEYKYRIRTPLDLMDKPKTWYFQSDLPVQWSEFIVTIPSFFYYQITMGGYHPVYLNEQTNTKVDMGYYVYDTKGVRYRVVLKDVPAFRDEAFITTPDDCLSKIDFELSQVALPYRTVKNYSTTWEDLDKTLLSSENWGDQIKRGGYMEEPVNALKEIPDMKERLAQAYDFMAKRYKWNGKTGVWVSEDLKKVYENRTGSATELNLSMMILLLELDFLVDPVILSTRDNGRVNPSFPLLDRFNYTIVAVYVENERILVDITDELLKPGSLPHRCLNHLARVVRPDGAGEIIEITGKDKYKELNSFTIRLDPQAGKLTGNYSNTGSGYCGHILRSSYVSAGEEKFRKNIEGGYKKYGAGNLKFEGFEDKTKNTVVSFDFEMEDEALSMDILYIDPMLFGKIEKNPFLKSKREYPVDFGYLTEQTVMGNYIIPEGFEVEELPKNLALALPDGGGRFSYFCSESEGKIQTVSKLIINKAVFTAESYHQLKDFYHRIVQKHGEQIILKKK